jgi:hypothetical protein
MAMQTIKVIFNDDGTATIKLPEGKSMMVKDPAKVAKITQQLADALGPTIERHRAHSHIHLTEDGKMVREDHIHGD